MISMLKVLMQMRRLPTIAIPLPVKTQSQQDLYQNFTKPHPRLKIIANKTWGVELINFSDFKTFDDYVQNVSGKNSATYFSRRCAKMGYTFQSFDPRLRIEDIITIHRSAESRQGRIMDESYLNNSLVYPVDNENQYFGVFQGNELVAYVWVRSSGALAIFNRIMGHSEHLKNSVMYLLCIETMQKLFKQSNIKHVMYDTFFGASDGLKLFKRRIGFKPYHVKWLQS